MKLNINKLFVGAIMAGALAATSCSDDFLETKPTDALSSADAIGTTDNAYAALNGIAESMTTQQYAFSGGFCGENYVMIRMEAYPSENYNYNYYASGWSPILNMEWLDKTNSMYIYYGWYYYYTLIGQANTILAHIDEAEGPDADKNFIKGAALTFRAYSYEKLLHYYAARWKDSNNGAAQGVVLRLDESTGDAPLSSIAEVYAQIYKDCEDAIGFFDASGIDRPSEQVWIPNKNVAHAVYARAALTKEDYSTALAQAKLAEAGYPLMSVSDYQSGFCRPTCEWLFGSYGDATENQWYWSYGTQYACNGDYASSDPMGAGGIGRELINRIPNNDARKALFLSEDKFPEYDFSQIVQWDGYFATYGILGAYEESDFDLEDPDDAALWASYEGLWDAAADYCEKMTPAGLETAYQSGYMYLDGQLKFWVFDQPGVSYLPFIRTSEMVLIEAEANYFLNNTAAAQAALVKLNKESGRNPEYSCNLTGEKLFDEICDYRILELWGEGSEWSDYKRWKKPIVRKSIPEGGMNHAAVSLTIQPNGSNNWIYAIPEGETNYNKGLNLGGSTIEE